MSLLQSAAAFDGMARVLSLRPTAWEINYLDFLMSSREQLRDAFSRLMTVNRLRGRVIVHLQFINVNNEDEGVEEVDDFYFTSLPSDFIYDFDTWFERHIQALINNIENFNRRCSNWVIFNVVEIEIPLCVIPNFQGGCSFKLPKKLQLSRAVINVRCADTSCFLYAVLSILRYNEISRDHQRVSKYKPFLDDLKFADISFPMKINDIPKFEKLNNIKINVQIFDKVLLGERYNDPHFIGEKTVNLLLVNNNGHWHYCGIRNLRSLYYAKHKNNSRFICERCIRHFSSMKLLNDHFQYCSQGKLQIPCMPKATTYSYKNFERELSPLLVCYADFESLIEPINNVHEPIFAASYSVWHEHFSNLNDVERVSTWFGKNCIISFLQHINNQATSLYKNSKTYQDKRLAYPLMN